MLRIRFSPFKSSITFSKLQLKKGPTRTARPSRHETSRQFTLLPDGGPSATRSK